MVAAKALLLDLINDFPGLLDGETEVNGADLVDSLSRSIQEIVFTCVECNSPYFAKSKSSTICHNCLGA